jgi:hypothetical protein
LISFEQFASEIGELAKDLEHNAEVYVGATAQALYGQAEGGTPVDTGESKGAWRWIKKDPLYQSFGNTTLQAAINDAGRRRSKRTRKMIGSKQARRGVVKPAVNRAIREQRKEIDKTIGRVFR